MPWNPVSFLTCDLTFDLGSEWLELLGGISTPWVAWFTLWPCQNQLPTSHHPPNGLCRGSKWWQEQLERVNPFGPGLGTSVWWLNILVVVCVFGGGAGGVSWVGGVVRLLLCFFRDLEEGGGHFRGVLGHNGRIYWPCSEMLTPNQALGHTLVFEMVDGCVCVFPLWTYFLK